MKKLIKEADVYVDFESCAHNIDINKIINYLVEARSLGAQEIDINIDFDNDLNISTFKLIEESDEEYNKRVERAKKVKDLITKNEIAEYERLKAKHGSK